MMTTYFDDTNVYREFGGVEKRWKETEIEGEGNRERGRGRVKERERGCERWGNNTLVALGWI